MKARISLAVLLIILFSSLSALADTETSDIKKRMKERYPLITDLKKMGKIGETHLGYVEAVDAKDEKDVAIQKILNEENNDRKQLYRLIASRTDTKPRLVGKQNAFRIFSKAGDEE